MGETIPKIGTQGDPLDRCVLTNWDIVPPQNEPKIHTNPAPALSQPTDPAPKLVDLKYLFAFRLFGLSYLEDMPEVLTAGGEDDLVGPDAPSLAGQGHVHQLLLILDRITRY